MAPPRNIAVDFYKVVMPEGGATLHDVLQALAGGPQGRKLNVQLGAVVVRVEDLRVRANVSEGEFVKIRMDFTPTKANVNGGVQPFQLGDDEGVGEETAFLYSAKLNVIAIQRNRYGVSASTIANYFQQQGAILDPIIFEPVINGDAMKRLDRMDEARSFTLRVAGAKPEALDRTKLGIKEVAELARAFGAPNVMIRVSMGYDRQRNLAIAAIKQAARRLVGLDPDTEGEVKELVITGKDAEDEPTLIDLVKDRMVQHVTLENVDERSVPYDVRRRAVFQAYDQRRTDLEEQFSGAV